MRPGKASPVVTRGPVAPAGAGEVTAGQIKGRFIHAFKTSPRWRVYLSRAELMLVGRVMHYQNDNQVFRADLRDRLGCIYNQIVNRRIGLFWPKAYVGYDRAYTLQKVIRRLLFGRAAAFSFTMQLKAAELFDIPVDEEKGCICASADSEARVLKYLRDKYFDAATGKLRVETREELASLNLRRQEDFMLAVEELEYLLSGV